MGIKDKLNKSDDQTLLHDMSGLIPEHITTREELFRVEFENINQAVLKYLVRKPSGRLAPFDYSWLLKLHQEMFGDVWQWAGKIRKNDLNIGVASHRVAEELQRFVGDFNAWNEYQHNAIEISAKIHHRLVWIHPFLNGNGRWARMASNIFLYQKEIPLVQWPEEELFIQSHFKTKYVQALKQADMNNYEALVALHMHRTSI
jgi:Fic-DOC domain mobile mystery protein B